MNFEDSEEASVTIQQLYKQLVEMLALPVCQVPAFDTGERAGNMFKGFEFLRPEKQRLMLRQAFRRPYVAPEVRKWMHSNGISPKEITALVRGQGVFIEDDRDRYPLIDFDHWANVNEKLRRQGAILPCDVETGMYQANAINMLYSPQTDDSEDDNESTRQDAGFLATCAEIVRAGLATFGNYFFPGPPGRM